MEHLSFRSHTVLDIPHEIVSINIESNFYSICLRPLCKHFHLGTFGKLLLSFSIYTNGSKLLNTDQASGSLTAVNGIRFISMTWVILGHAYSFILSDVGKLNQHMCNKKSYYKNEKFLFQLMYTFIFYHSVLCNALI